MGARTPDSVPPCRRPSTARGLALAVGAALLVAPLVGCIWSVGVPGPTAFSVVALAADSIAWGSIQQETTGADEPAVVFLMGGQATILLPGLEPPEDDADEPPPLRPPPPPEAPILQDTLVVLEGTPLYLVAAGFGPEIELQDGARKLLLRIADQAPPGAVVVAVVALGRASDGTVLDRLVGGYLQGRENCAGAEGSAPEQLRVYYAPVALVQCTGSGSFPIRSDLRSSGPLLRLRTRN